MRAVISNPPSETGNPPEKWESEGQIPNPKHQITNKSQITICNDPNIFGILFFKTDVQVWDFEFKKENELNSNSEFRNQKRLHSLPLVVIFPVAFAYSSAADGQYPAGETFGRYGGV